MGEIEKFVIGVVVTFGLIAGVGYVYRKATRWWHLAILVAVLLTNVSSAIGVTMEHLMTALDQ